MRSNPPAEICPNGLPAAVAAISTPTVTSPAGMDQRALRWVATAYKAITGASRAAPLT